MSSSGDDKMPAPSPTCEFKKPPALLTVGKVGGKKKFRAPEPPKLNPPPITIAKENSTLLEKKEGKDQSLVPVPMVKLKQTTLSIGPDSQDGKILYPAQKCPYDEPSWGGRPEVDFRLSVLKNGTIIGSEKLAKSFFVVGRHQDCDLIMEHPSISRFHAVLQYRKPHPDATDPEKRLGGFYLFDLGSTHGTQLNRQPVDAKSYRRVRVGHHIKFGFSTRAFILEGPAEDEEAESELSVTEIIELRKKREAEWKLMREAERVSKEEAARKRDEEDRDAGINWGMAEDATEEDEECPTMSDVNPFAFGTAENVDEQLYLDDPKKTLRGWFEREGYELEYHVEEKGPQQFICRVKLPIDVGSGSAVIAEACVKGRKKEAVVQCAMEACRILDRHDELRKAHHDSRAKKNLKNWKEDDYYDSDEDEFFDRTGDLVTKREQRKARLEHKGQTVETYESLKEKLAITENAIREINESLEKSKAVEAASKASGDGGDSLESFMKQLKAGTALDKAKRSQLRLDHARLTAEQIRLIRLVNIAKPTELPPLKAMSILPDSSLKEGQRSTEKSVTPMVGSMRGRKRPVLPLTGMPAKVMRMHLEDANDKVLTSTQTSDSTVLRAEPQNKKEEDENETKVEKNTEDEDQNKVNPIKIEQKETMTSTRENSIDIHRNNAHISGNSDDIKNEKNKMIPTEIKQHTIAKFQQLNLTRPQRAIGPTLPPGMLEALNKTSTDDTAENNKLLKLQPSINAAVAENIRESSTPTRNEDFDDWLPPAGQTGDGRTPLNDKFGY